MATRLAQLEDDVQSGLPGNSSWGTYVCTMASGGPTVRDMLWKAIAEFDLPSAMGGDVADAQALVQRAMQSMQSSGFFPWQLCNTNLDSDDANSVEFTSVALAILLRGHASQLDATTVASITAQVPTILSALQCDTTAGCADSPRGSALTDNYTNVWLLNASAQILLSGVPGLEASVSAGALTQGIGEVTQWNQLTAESGIIEYDSPTYYGVDLEALAPAYVFVDDAHRSVIQQALDSMWRDIAANYFASRESVSGSHSRNYNFLESYGGVDWHTYMLGWRPDVPQTVAEPAIERAILLDLTQHSNAYVPAAGVVAASGTCTRVVASRWGSSTVGATRYNVVTPTYALSSVSAGFGPQDQQFVAELGDHDLPVVSVVVDDTNDPYGDEPVTMGIFSKPEHVVPRPLGVQQNGYLFGMLEITPNLTSTSLATNVIFPLGAQTVMLDDEAIAAAVHTIGASTASVLGVRDQGACIAARILLADPYASTVNARLELVVDAAGLSLNVGRLVAYHALPSADAGTLDCTTAWTSGAAPLSCQPRAALVMAAAACSSDADLSQLMSSVRTAMLTTTDPAATTWTASLNLAGAVYSGARDRTTGQIVTQSVDGTAMSFAAALCVNGVDPTGASCD
jgi:hypothetical protein